MTKKVIVHFENGTARDFGDAAWNWDADNTLLTIMQFVNGKSMPVAFIPRESLELLEIEWSGHNG